MRRRLKIAALLLVVLVGSASALLLLDFRAATSVTQTHSQVRRYSAGDFQIDLAGGLYVYVEGDDDLARELRSQLAEKLRQQGIQVFEADALKEEYDRQTLIVTLLDRKLSYNPFYPSASLESLFVYSSSGDSTYFESFKTGEPVVHLSTGQLLIVGKSTLNDTTKGVISIKAYQRYLAEGIANIIIQELAKHRD